MQGIVADVNVEGHVRQLCTLFESQEWAAVWRAMALQVLTIPDLGLDRRADDTLVWRTCQERQLVLVTGNRNKGGPTALETAIRTLGTLNSLPVLTIANPDRVRRDHAYALRVAERMLERLFDIEALRGSGRIYVP